MTFLAKTRLYAWGTAQLLRYGRPDVALGFLGGIGDDLLCTAPIEEWLRRGARRIWFFTRHPDLYPNFDRRVRLIPDEPRYQRIAQRFGQAMRPLAYSTYDTRNDRDTPVDEHLIVEMCRRAGLSGEIQLRPHLSMTSAELARAAEWSGTVAIQTSSLTAAVPMGTKQWPAERFQAVTDYLLTQGLRVVQIGSPADPALRGAIDRRGRTRLRETAALLAQARFFIGLVGFLMHLSRAVDCPAVIVYGGREPPELTGYICNTHVAHRPPCAPCWHRNRCDFGHVCMESISANDVIQAVDSRLVQPRAPLPFTTVRL